MSNPLNPTYLHDGETAPRRQDVHLPWVSIGLVSGLLLSVLTARCHAQSDEALQQLQRRVVSTVEQVEKSIVAIARVPKNESAGAFQLPNVPLVGSRVDEGLPTDADFVPNDFAAGVVIDRQGLILTTYHAIGNIGTSDYYVWSQHRPFRASVVAADGWFDLAVLKIETSDLEAIRFGDIKDVSKGQFVIALGNPQGIARDGVASVTSGIVANFLRRAPRVPERSKDQAGRETVHHYGSLLQTDIELGAGFDGGAIVNLDGEMIGLATAFSGAPKEPKSAGFAIPVDEYFLAAVEQLKAGKSVDVGFLGVRPRPLELKLRQEGHRGTLVESVEPETPAAVADIRPGDVILSVDHQSMTDDDDLIRVIGSIPAGRTIQVAVFRGDLGKSDGVRLEKQVTLSKKPVSTWRPPYSTVAGPSWRGIRVDYSSAAPKSVLLAAKLPSEGSQLLHVVEVDPESPAYKAGIRANMFLAKVGDTVVKSPAEFISTVENLDGDVSLHALSPNGSPAVYTVSP